MPPFSLSPSDESLILKFTTIDKLFQDINSTDGDALFVRGMYWDKPFTYEVLIALYSDLSAQNFLAIEQRRDGVHRHLRLKYLTTGKSTLLIITIPTLAHELLHLELNMCFLYQLVPMGLESQWLQNGATTRRSRKGDSSGEGDSSGCPDPPREFGDDWPTLIIEAGFSQSLESLQNIMRWWFSASEHQVKIVVLAKMDVQQHTITIEKYTEYQPADHLPRVATRTTSAHVQRRDHHITISRSSPSADLRDPNSYVVDSNTPVTLEFRKLFLREPRDREHDVTITTQQLQAYAVKAWKPILLPNRPR